MKLFQEYKIKNMALRNKIVLPPMDMYSADAEGNANDIHFNHYVSRAIGGTGLIIVEATAITPNGRISDKCLGIWNEKQQAGLEKIAKACQLHGAKVALQINHAGRKCTAEGSNKGYTIAPSPIAFDESYRVPKEITLAQIKEVVEQFKAAASRAAKAGFDALEIHGAHGYLISEFLSPLTNKRTDEYGGSLENRARFLIEVLAAIKTVWPEEKPIIVRVSASDHLVEGMQPEQMVEIIKLIKPYIDLVHVSSGGVALAPIELYPGYQVKYSEMIKHQCQIPTITVGLIKTPELVEEILGNDRADLVAMGRELFRNPAWVLQTAYANNIDYEYPQFYKEAFRKKK
ncbi:MAG: NADPH dehydrogenase NamA [Clostridia bacterium]